LMSDAIPTTNHHEDYEGPAARFKTDEQSDEDEDQGYRE